MASRTLRRTAKDTLTAVEMNCGDTLEFTLRNGQARTLAPEATSMRVLEQSGALVYAFSCRLRIDGHPVELRRYVGSQESFYEPPVVNGVRIWLDAVKAIFDRIPMRKIETQRLPRKDVRLALQDATLPVCPQPMHPWYRNEGQCIDIADCYNGDDCWLGPYLGRACHGGLDVNHPKGAPLWAPIDFDDQWLFNSLAAGHNNNRWRGIRRWPNGETWALQTHHIVKLLVPEHTPLKAGTHYASAAGVHVGSHNHTHFVFKVTPAEGGPEIHLDPWILFWQIFETQKAKAGALQAAMAPLAPAETGQPVAFSAAGSRPGRQGRELTCTWAFGDGGCARGCEVRHVFTRPGVYPVTLVVNDGAGQTRRVQHLTVDGDPVPSPALVLAAPDELSFRPRPVGAMEVYGQPVRTTPHTLGFLARPSRPRPRPKTFLIENRGGGRLPQATVEVGYEEADGWLIVTRDETGSALKVAVDAAGLEPRVYGAVVTVRCPGAVNSPQVFAVRLRVPAGPPARGAVIDDQDPSFACTPWFWVGHRSILCKRRGHEEWYLTNGGRPWAGEVARFTPDLAAGRYRVAFHEDTPFRRATRFDVRVRHRGGDSVVRIRPGRSRAIGTFEFEEGADGFVEIRAEGSRGLVIADAVVFEPLE
ncbi:MAG: PKD domain-containing protein [Planctomycetota bacterium]